VAIAREARGGLDGGDDALHVGEHVRREEDRAAREQMRTRGDKRVAEFGIADHVVDGVAQRRPVEHDAGAGAVEPLGDGAAQRVAFGDDHGHVRVLPAMLMRGPAAMHNATRIVRQRSETDMAQPLRRMVPLSAVAPATVLKMVPYFWTLVCNSSSRWSVSSVSTMSS